MTSQTPLVSFGLPVYNGQKFVAQAIQCVLDQTVSDWELVISDNCSSDHTLDICRSFADRDSRIRIHPSPRNMGVCFNFDRAFRLSCGRYFKWITHDDLFAPQLVERCLQELEKDASVVLAMPKLSYVDADRRVLRRQPRDLSVLGRTIESRAKQFMALAAQGMDFIWLAYGLARRDILEQAGSMGWHAGSDQVLLFKLALRGSIKQIDEEMFFRREHPDAETCRGGSTVRERAKGAYADDNRRLVLPWCRNLKEHLLAVLRSHMPFQAKLGCTAAVLKRFSAMWKFFAEEAIQSPMDALRWK